ncbi:MAG: WYL domain-containing protein [bacterium]|nr:WYL domain-containing protein [bacterium]
MLKPDLKTDPNQISLTGVRAIALLGLLILAPRSLDEIRESFLKMGLIDETHSNDILRIDLNTIKAIGCEVSRACAKTNYKYVLTKHPFALDIGKNEIKILKKLYDKIKITASIEQLVNLDTLFKKLTQLICDDEVKESILGISILKHYNIDEVMSLYNDCKKRRTVKLIYKKTADSEIEKDIAMQQMILKNDRLYIYGYDLNKNIQTVLNIKRIKTILTRSICSANINPVYYKVKFSIKEDIPDGLEQRETLTQNENGEKIVTGEYYNEFFAMQRVLSLGSNCTVLEPLGFRKSVIQKLKEMRKIYE